MKPAEYGHSSSSRAKSSLAAIVTNGSTQKYRLFMAFDESSSNSVDNSDKDIELT